MSICRDLWVREQAVPNRMSEPISCVSGDADAHASCIVLGGAGCQ
jgi:hypothetical protein